MFLIFYEEQTSPRQILRLSGGIEQFETLEEVRECLMTPADDFVVGWGLTLQELHYLPGTPNRVRAVIRILYLEFVFQDDLDFPTDFM